MTIHSFVAKNGLKIVNSNEISGITTTSLENNDNRLATEGQIFRELSGKTDNSLFVSHTGNTYNPHNTTYTQVGAYSTGETDNLLTYKYDKSGGTISGDMMITGNAIVLGNVTIMGTATTINTQTLSIKDNIITVSSDQTGSTAPLIVNSGLEVFRNSATTATLIWSELNKQWEGGLSGNTSKIILATDGLSSLSNTAHTHSINEVINLQSELDNKFNSSGGTIVGSISAITVSATTFYGDGSQLIGISTDNFYTTASTLVDKTIYFNRNNGLSAYTANLSSLAYQSDVNNKLDKSGGTITNYLTVNSGLTISSFANSAATSVLYVTSGGTIILGDELKDAFITDIPTILLLTNTGNWNSTTNAYVGPTLTGLTSGMRYVNDEFSFEYINTTMYRNSAKPTDVTPYTTNLAFGIHTGDTSIHHTISELNGLYVNISGDTMIGTLYVPTISATTISATTFYGDGSNLNGISSANYFTTGATLSSSTVTFTRNDNNTYDVNLSALTTTNLPFSAITNTPNNFTGYGITGGTISGLTISSLANSAATSVLFITSGGTIELGDPLKELYISDAYTIALLTNTSNWDANNTYIGTTLTGLTSGQKYLSEDYTFEYVIDSIYRNASKTQDVSGFITSVTFVSHTGDTNIHHSLTELNGLYMSISAGSGTFTGGTVNGETIFTNGLTANTFSATSISVGNYIDFATGSSATTVTAFAGRVYFDAYENALSYFPVTPNMDVTVNLGEEVLIKVYNNTGFQINNGQVCHINGTTDGTPTITLATGNVIYDDSEVSGVATHNIANGAFGFITKFGLVRDIMVTGTTPGQTIYLSDKIVGALEYDINNISLGSRINKIGRVINTGTTTGKIIVDIRNENVSLTLTDKQINILNGNVSSTGIYQFSGITTASTNTINVAPAKGWIVNNTYSFALAPTTILVSYSGQTGLSITNIASADETYILLTTGNTIFQQTSYPTAQQRRQNILLGKVAHPDRSSIISINNNVDYAVSPMSALRDMFTPIKLLNDSIAVSPNGANLNFNISSGLLYGMGINWTNNELNPNEVTISGKTAAQFNYRTQTGGTSTYVTTIDPNNYDLNGVITAISAGGDGSANRSTNQRIYLYPSGNINIQYGQIVYDSLALALAAQQTESFVKAPNVKTTGILIGLLAVRRASTVLNSTTYAVFTPASIFGESVGGVNGISTTTLQQAYNNSTTPEIIINSALDGLTIQNGTGNADNITNLLEGKNTAGATTSFIRADGYISGNTFQTNAFLGNGNGVSANTISATTITSYNDITIGNIIVGRGGGALSANTAIGYQSLNGNSTGTGNVGAGYRSLYAIGAGSNNVGLGYQAMRFSAGSNTNGNVAIGYQSLYANVTGSTNVGVGYYSLYSSTGVTNIGIGSNAGRYAVSNNELYIDNRDRTSNILEKKNAIIYGVMSTTATTQSLYLNAKTYISNNYSLPTVSGGTGQVIMQNADSTTYWGLPTDIYTTGFTYSNNNLNITRNGGLSALLVNISTMTGLTINGNLTVTGTSSLNGTISSTSLSGTTDRLVQASSGGTISASKQIIDGIIATGSTTQALLSATSGWTINGAYTGTAITSTYMGQTAYDDNYMYFFVADNQPIRLIRG